MKRLILLTINYPYKPGDIFLCSEQRFFPDDLPVDAVPTGFDPSKTEPADALPDNVTLLPFAWKPVSPLSHAYYMAVSLLRKDVRRDLRSLRKEKKAGLRTLVRTLSWISYGERVFRLTEKHYRRELSECPGQLVFYSFWLLIPAYAAARLRKKYGCHAVARGHGGDIFEERSDMGRLPMRKFTLENLDYVSVCSKDGQRYLIDRYRTGDIRQSYLGTFDHGVRTVSMPAEGEPFVIASCANVIPLKRVGLIAEALSLITDRRIEWLHFGDGTLFEDLKRAAGELPDNITARLIGRVPHDRLMDYYSANDVHLFISASETEGLPVSVMEALSFGIPVMATDAGGTRETVTPGHGTLLPVELEAGELAGAIRRFSDTSPEEYSMMRADARAFWENNFSAERNYSEFYNALREL